MGLSHISRRQHHEHRPALSDHDYGFPVETTRGRRRITWLWQSAIHTQSASTATPYGKSNVAASGLTPSTAGPATPQVPATTDTTSSGEIARIQLFPVSAT